ncbi:MAG: TetR/AcrR family transcriptional regulator [Deltaproteobacteria bacterium]|nr:TetR/AcrR family transcriptional regulator [Deltaproteobacteria bacterium]
MDRETRRAQILEAATAVFAEKGYHGARVDDIVARAQIAKGTFYLYFPDKRAIFGVLVDGFVERIHGVLEPVVLGDPSRPPVLQAQENVRRVVSLCLDDAPTAKILLSDAVGLDGAFDRRLLAFYDDLTALVEDGLRLGVDAGFVRPGDTRVRAFCLLGMVKELMYQLVLRRLEVPREDLVATVMSLVLDGLFTEEAQHLVSQRAR